MRCAGRHSGEPNGQPVLTHRSPGTDSDHSIDAGRPSTHFEGYSDS